MEGAGIVTFALFDYKTPQSLEKEQRWAKTSDIPMVMSTGYLLVIENGFPLEENKLPTQLFIVNYFKDMESYFAQGCSAVRNAEWKQFEAVGREVERTWFPLYHIVRRFNALTAAQNDKGSLIEKGTYLKEYPPDDGPVVLIKGLALSPGDWDAYNRWDREWGWDVYLPMLLKIPGVVEYCRSWQSNVLLQKPGHTLYSEFPQDLSVFYFADMPAYRNFQKSKELAAYNQNLNNAFPGGLDCRWDKAFHLFRRWSK
jgi:hypothetical protein